MARGEFAYKEVKFGNGETAWIDIEGLEYLVHRFAFNRARMAPSSTQAARHNSYMSWKRFAYRQIGMIRRQNPTRLRFFICEMMDAIQSSREIFQSNVAMQQENHRRKMQALSLGVVKNTAGLAELGVGLVAIAGTTVAAPITLSVAVVAAGSTIYYEHKVNKRAPETCVAMGTLSLVPMGTEVIAAGKGGVQVTTKVAISLGVADALAGSANELITSGNVKQAVIKGLSMGLAKGGSAGVNSDAVADTAAKMWSTGAQKLGGMTQAVHNGVYSTMGDALGEEQIANGDRARKPTTFNVNDFPQIPWQLARRLVVRSPDLDIAR
jgi:hypothetical protein